MKLPTLTFASLWAAMVLLHGNFFLIRTPPSFPIFSTITSPQPTSTAPPPSSTTATLDNAAIEWHSPLSSPWFFSALNLFALHFLSAVLSASYKRFMAGKKIDICKDVREAWRAPLRSLATAYVLEYAVREVVLFGVAAGLDANLMQGSREQLRWAMKVFVRF